jgi:hypothetical protein
MVGSVMAYLPTMYTATLILTAAQLKTLNSSPVQIVAGTPGQIICLESAYFQYNYNSVAFNVASTDFMGVYVGTASSSNVVLSGDGTGFPALGFLDQSQNMGLWTITYLDVAFGGGTEEEGAAVQASILRGSGLYITQFTENSFPSGTNWSVGNGTMAVFVRYSFIEA